MTSGVYRTDRADAQWQPARSLYSHDALIDAILAKPTATNLELGALFGRSAQWVSLVRNSDLFRENLYKRQHELLDPLLLETIEQRFSTLTQRSLEVLLDKLAKPSAEVPDALALEAAKLGAKAKGVGGFASRPVEVVTTPAIDRIEKLADRLTALNRPSTPVQEISDARIIPAPVPPNSSPAGAE